MKRLALLAALLWSTAAQADMGLMLLGVQSPPHYPLDGITTPAGAYSFRRLLTSYTANKAVNIIRASDLTASDIGFTADGRPDVATMTTFCNATTCSDRWWYDQSGVVRDIGNATGANQPALVLSCKGTLPCLRLTTNTQSLQSAGTLTPVAPVSLNIVAVRSVGTTNACFFRTSGAASNSLGQRAGAAGLNLAGSSGTITNSAAEAAWHTATGIVNGASSSLAYDGNAATAGTVTTAVAAGITGLFGGASTTCSWGEIVAWSGYGITTPETAMVTVNQQSFWGL